MMPRRACLILGVCIFGLLAWSANAGSSAFDAANKLYEQGKYSDAVAGYTNMLASGEISAAVYYNLGNAYFKGGQLGRAIAAYERAALLSPRDMDLRANLQFARGQVSGPTTPPGRWRHILEMLTLNEWTVLAASAVWGFFLFLGVGQWRPAWRPALRNLTLLSAATTVLLCALLGAALQNRSEPRAIVIEKDSIVRQSPLPEAHNAFVVHDGAEMNVLDEQPGWLQVSAGPRQIGWLPVDQVIQMRRP